VSSDDIIRRFVREILILESTAPERSVSSEIFQSIVNSRFWEFPHNENDVDLVDSSTWSTPAIEVLMDALNNASISSGSDLYFILSVTDDEKYTLGPDDQYGGYPNNWLMRGQYRGPEKGKHIIWLEFRPISEDYSKDQLDPGELVKILSRTINHEIVHYNQLKKQAISKNISEEEAWEELVNDPRQLSKSGTQEDYLSLHNEIDAFAYEAAEELLDRYTEEEALSIISRNDNELDGIVGRYNKTLGDDKESLYKFLGKVYSNIKKISNEIQPILEKKKRKKKKKSERDSGFSWHQGTPENLYLDREIKALPNLSIRKNGKEVPVNVQIRDYLKSMKLIPEEDMVEKIFNKILSEYGRDLDSY
tara:strand:+ start:142 stop:1230 length:1089 start_codon:yes stop_codon:yes gene_type:complete